MRNLFKFGFVLAIAVAVFFALGGVERATAQAPVLPPPIYNLYATDGYIELPDGGPLYMYGFIGGRASTPFTYQSSYCTSDGVTTTCTPPVNTTITTGAPAPTGGPIQPAEAPLAGNAQFPAPIIWATVGQPVEIRLKNLGISANPAAPNDPHSIHLHGLDVDAANDGVPETSVGAVPANLAAPGAGNVIVYMFAPTKPGTYMYHCHQEADIHVQMGMYGALVVYNVGDAAADTGPGMGMGGNLWGFPYDKDYIMLLSEFDVRGHQDEEGTYAPNAWDPVPYNWALYQPQYWMINGLSFPNTIHAGWLSGFTFSDWLLAHPGYDPLITGSVSFMNNLPGSWKTPGDKVLIRVINMGFETQPMHMHGYHGKILGSDQRAWDWANKPGNTSPKNPKPPTAFGVGLEKNTLTIGSGETYEWLVDFGQQMLTSTYPAGTQTRYFDPFADADPVAAGTCATDTAALVPAPLLNEPVSNTFVNCPIIPEAGAAGAPTYIGGPVVSGAVGLPSTSQFFPFHNHDDYKATNNGLYPGGMFTMLVPLP